MEKADKQICLYYERNITEDVKDIEIDTIYCFKGTSSKEDQRNKLKYKLFCDYTKQMYLNNMQNKETQECEPDQYNYAIQHLDDEERSELEICEDSRKSGSEVLKKGPTPFTTMYYNDPNYQEGRGSDTNSTMVLSVYGQGQARIGNNGLTGTADQQSKNSLIQNVTSSSNDLHHSRPATKDDFIIHQVKISDTLGRISIQYDVSKDAIRMANGFLGEEVYMHKTLRIPFTYGEVYHVPEDQNEKERKRQWAQETLHQSIRDVNRNNENYSAEVKFYLELANFDTM